MRPSVSIITPVFNGESFFSDCIDSVQNQEFENWEWIIIDDASTDGTFDMIKSLAELDERVIPVSLKVNGGAGSARNAGLDLARGKYVAFLDSDDLWLPEKLERQLSWMESKNHDFTYTAYRRVTVGGQEIGYGKVPKKVTYHGLLKNTAIGTSTTILLRDVIGKTRFRQMRIRQDLVFWLEILKNGIEAHGMLEELAIYRVRSGSISRNKKNAMAVNWAVYRDIEHLNLPKASWYFAHYVVRAIMRNYFSRSPNRERK